jgi:hypothetical protein
MSYLDEAAALLRKAADTNERRNTAFGTPRTDREMNEGRERIAMQFAQLAAIERGLIPAEMVGEMLAAAVRSEVPR